MQTSPQLRLWRAEIITPKGGAMGGCGVVINQRCQHTSTKQKNIRLSQVRSEYHYWFRNLESTMATVYISISTSLHTLKEIQCCRDLLWSNTWEVGILCCVAMSMYPDSQSIRYKPETILNEKKLKWIFFQLSRKWGLKQAWQKQWHWKLLESVRLKIKKKLKALNATSVSFPVRLALFQSLFGSLWNPTQPVGDSGIFPGSQQKKNETFGEIPLMDKLKTNAIDIKKYFTSLNIGKLMKIIRRSSPKSLSNNHTKPSQGTTPGASC